MADEREPYEPLWAAGLAVERRPPPDSHEPAPAPGATRSLVGPAIAGFGILAVLWYAAIMSAVSGELTVAEVPSAWGPVAMNCAVVRVEDRDATVEAFRCRAVPSAAEDLPTGVFSSAETLWRSDVDRRPAREHLITISPEGELVGRAIYTP